MNREAAGLELLCGLLGYTRQAYYGQYRRTEHLVMGTDLVVQEVLSIRQRQKRIGARKLHHMMNAFFEAHDMRMGRDRFLDLLREQQLLVRRRCSRKPRTTYSAFWMKRYRNLAREFVPVRSNQLWVSDITYLRVGKGFCYLSLVTDAYSRKIVGYV